MPQIKNLICITVGFDYNPGFHACIYACVCFSVCVCVHVYERHRELFQTAAVQELEWSRGGVDVRGGQRARAQMLVSSGGEDRAILLGFTMMAFSVLMFFLVCITMVKPYVSRYRWTI